MAYYNQMKKYKDKILAISDKGNQITYGEAEELCRQIGDIIIQRCLVFVFCENSLGSLCSYIASLYNNIVPLLLKADMGEELRQNLIEIYRPAYIYVPDKMKEEFGTLECVYEAQGYKLLRTEYIIEDKMAEDLALLLTTSGSTGSPKLVRQSYRNIQANAESIVEYLKLDDTERPITTLPMNYTYGLSIINSHMNVGATLLLTNYTLMEKGFWEFFKEQEATSFGGVPYTYEILKKLRFFKMNLSSLRTMTQAGGKLSPELHKEYAEYAKETGRHFIVMYGQTEATARMAYLPYEKALEKYGSMGIAIPGGKLWLKDTEGKEIQSPDTIGELVYEGENVTLGYAECRLDLEKSDERHGILETGDMAKKDPDGFFYIVGRKKRFLKIFGNRVNLDETERMIKAHFEGMECACTGVDDKLYVFITVENEELCKEVHHFLAAKTGLNQTAFAVKTVDEVPKNEAGKILYTKLEKYYD